MDTANGTLEVTQADGPEGRGSEERCIEVLDSLLQVHVFGEVNALKSYSAQSCCT
jgi:hypothetical protein